MLLVEAVKAEYLAEAEGKKALYKAKKLLSSEIISMKIKQAIIEHLSDIINASVKPKEAISDIKILQVDALNGGLMSHPETNSNSGSRNLAEQMVNSALHYRSQAPLVDAILKEIGIYFGEINGLIDSIKDFLVQEVHATQTTDKSHKH
ncbi:MAG: flotillin domain-containing protein [bacterium]